MKIYPGNHQVYAIDSVNLDEQIPLCYLDTDFIVTNASITIDNNFDSSSTSELLPFSIIDNLEKTFFDKNSEPLSKDEQTKLFTRQTTGKYLYQPKTSTVFNPYLYTYKVLAKKSMIYSASRKFNIKVACHDSTLANKLIPYFADSYDRNLCPNNIKFNNGDKKVDSLLSSTYDGFNMVFISSSDGITYDGKTAIDIDSFLEKNIVPFIISKNAPDSKDNGLTAVEDFELLNNIIFNNSTISVTEYFSIPNNTSNITYHNIFKYNKSISPLLIKEFKDKGYVIYCKPSFIDGLNAFSNIFYEVLLYVYCNSYASTASTTDWITDELPDYVVENNKLTHKNRFTSALKLTEMLDVKDGEASIVDISIKDADSKDSNVVFYTGMLNGYLMFKKISSVSYADPVKQDGSISIYTSRKNIIYCNSLIYSIKEDISNKISCSVSDNSLTVSIKPFKNTDLDTYNFLSTVTLSTDIDTSVINQNVYLMWNKSIKGFILTKSLLSEQTLIAVIQVINTKEDSKLYDMRVRGGGISESSEDDYNCLDIGNVLGRPYRRGGTLIITIKISKSHESLKDAIYSAAYNSISKYMVSGNFLILNLEFE
jgi:hypothetical protein